MNQINKFLNNLNFEEINYCRMYIISTDNKLPMDIQHARFCNFYIMQKNVWVNEIVSDIMEKISKDDEFLIFIAIFPNHFIVDVHVNIRYYERSGTFLLNTSPTSEQFYDSIIIELANIEQFDSKSIYLTDLNVNSDNLRINLFDSYAKAEIDFKD